jgi:hypothetical protein
MDENEGKNKTGGLLFFFFGLSLFLLLSFFFYLPAHTKGRANPVGGRGGRNWLGAMGV